MRFAVVVLATQVLLVGVTLAWCVHMALILRHGAVYLVEPNLLVLYAELATTALVAIFATAVFLLQWKRMGERRRNDEEGNTHS